LKLVQILGLKIYFIIKCFLFLIKRWFITRRVWRDQKRYDWAIKWI
jgi:hypothetical protein